MEKFEIRYFLAAAAHQNLHKAAKQASVSIPAISRAISRLEEELGTQLFNRVGRNIELSSAGITLQRDAAHIIGLIEDVKIRFRPSNYSVPISLCGTEFGISMFLPEIVKRLKAQQIEFTLNVRTFHNSKRVERALMDGETQLGIVAGEIKLRGLTRTSLGKFESKTLVGPGHPLYKTAKLKRSATIEEVLKYEFVSFSEAVLSEHLTDSELQDGWRDDKFTRKIGLKTESIEAALRVIESGDYLGYLPLDLASKTEILPLPTLGCPYTCTTTCYLLGKQPDEFSWMKNLFSAKSLQSK